MISEQNFRKGFLKSFLAVSKKVYQDFAHPMLQRPKPLQTAALCYCKEGDAIRVLLVSSRGTKRWIIPKGWPMRGKTTSEAAVIEAWEEAGVRAGRTSDVPLGTYVYDKISDSGLPVRVETLVFAVEVKALEECFPEAGERRRKWVTPSQAAQMVAEPGLKKIVANFTGADSS